MKLFVKKTEIIIEKGMVIRIAIHAMEMESALHVMDMDTSRIATLQEQVSALTAYLRICIAQVNAVLVKVQVRYMD